MKDLVKHLRSISYLIITISCLFLYLLLSKSNKLLLAQEQFYSISKIIDKEEWAKILIEKKNELQEKESKNNKGGNSIFIIYKKEIIEVDLDFLNIEFYDANFNSFFTLLNEEAYLERYDMFSVDREAKREIFSYYLDVWEFLNQEFYYYTPLNDLGISAFCIRDSAKEKINLRTFRTFEEAKSNFPNYKHKLYRVTNDSYIVPNHLRSVTQKPKYNQYKYVRGHGKVSNVSVSKNNDEIGVNNLMILKNDAMGEIFFSFAVKRHEFFPQRILLKNNNFKDIRTGSFEFSFPDLYHYSKGFKDFKLENLKKVIERDINIREQKLPLIGIQIFSEDINFVTLIFYIMVLLYFYVHYKKLEKNLDILKGNDTPWYGVYKEIIPQLYLFFTYAVLPITIIFLVLLKEGNIISFLVFLPVILLVIIKIFMVQIKIRNKIV